MQVEQIDREAATKWLVNTPAVDDWCGYEDQRALVQAFARHRTQERAEVVGEIVAELRGLHWTHRDAEPAKRIADEIEAKFGGRD